MLIDHLFPEAHARDMLTHELRWARTIRLIKPSGYLGSVVTHFLVLGALGALLCHFSSPTLAVLAALMVLRWVQALVLSLMLHCDRGLLWLLPVRDMLSFAVFLAAIFGNRVAWRGQMMRFRRNGAMAAT